MNLDDYNKSSCVKALVYGRPKSGKTALVGKLAEHYKLHWLDLENGIKTLLNPEILKPEFRKNVNVINIPDHRLNPVAIDTVRQIFKGGLKKICYDHGKITCPLCAKNPAARYSEIDLGKFTKEDILVIDSMSQLGSSAMNRVILRELQKPDGEEYKPTYQDYMSQGALLDQVLSMIQVLDMNIVVISHEVDTEKDEKKEALVPLGGTRNFSKTMAKYFDSVVYCTILNKAHRAHSETTYSPTVLTGSRLSVGVDAAKGNELSLLPLFKRE